MQISKEVIAAAIEDIQTLLDRGDIVDPASFPKYQTKPDLFDRKEPHWVTLRETFLAELSANGYTGDITHVKCWCYANLPGQKQDKSPDKLWHIHTDSDLSGVLYLALPDKSETTVFDIGGGQVSAPRIIGEWFTFLSAIVHRPGIWDETISEPRYCLAATVTFSNRSAT